MVYKNSDDYLMLSGIQHFYFCKRQWCLIHIEQQWEDNRWTMEGQVFHQKSDNPYVKEKRKDHFISRAMPVSSATLGLSGILDVVEFVKDDDGIPVPGKRGKWRPSIVEFKKGAPKNDLRDVVQLVAEVICLEEKLQLTIPISYLFYGKTNRKQEIQITEELRQLVQEMAQQMHDLYDSARTTPAETYKNCKECSLVNICMPRITKKKVNVDNYIRQRMNEEFV